MESNSLNIYDFLMQIKSKIFSWSDEPIRIQQLMKTRSGFSSSINQLLELIISESGSQSLIPNEFMNLSMIAYAKNPDLVDEIAS